MELTLQLGLEWGGENTGILKNDALSPQDLKHFLVYVCICLGTCVYMYIARVGLTIGCVCFCDKGTERSSCRFFWLCQLHTKKITTK